MRPEHHRRMNTLLIILMGTAIVLAIVSNKHSMKDCEDRLYEKLTGKPIPKEIK